MARPSPAQQAVRKIYRASCDCFNSQLDAGGVTPPDLGARNKTWWYDQSVSVNPAYLYRGKDLSWDGRLATTLLFNSIYGIDKTVTQFFSFGFPNYSIEFELIRLQIEETPTYFLYEGIDPWYAGRDPDEVIMICWKAIRDNHSVDEAMSLAYLEVARDFPNKITHTALSFVIYLYAFTRQALILTGKSDTWIKEHTSCIFTKRTYWGNGILWWKESGGSTQAIRPELFLHQIPATIQDTVSWSYTPAKNLYTRFDHDNCFDPWVKPPPPTNHPRYFNFFMKATLDKYHAGEFPDWCVEQPTDDSWVTSEFPDENQHQTQEARDRLRVAAWPSGVPRMRAFIKLPAGKHLKYLWIYASAGHKTGAEPWRQVGCYKTLTDDWTENAITWNNQPALGILLFQTYILTAGWYRFSIHKEHSFCLKFIDENLPAGSTQEIYFTSKDNEDAAHREFLQY